MKQPSCAAPHSIIHIVKDFLQERTTLTITPLIRLTFLSCGIPCCIDSKAFGPSTTEDRFFDAHTSIYVR